MSTLSELRSGLRTLLNDNAAEGYLWSDAALNLFLNDALKSYSRSLPRERKAVITAVAGQAEYDLPSDCTTVTLVRVEGLASKEMIVGGDAFGMGFELYEGKLVLLDPPTTGGHTIEVGYVAAHAPLISDADVSTAPSADEDLILASAAALALQSLATEEAKRQRFEQRAGEPASRAANLCWERYEAGVRERGSRVRVGRLVAS